MKPLRHYTISLTIGVCALMLLLDANGLAATAPGFLAGKPVWIQGRETEMNLTAGFRAVFEARPNVHPVRLRATGASLYRVYLNGEFLGHGPARGPHGYFRVDEWDISPKMKPGQNTVAFEVAGYNANSYYLLNQPSFLQAEVVQGADVLASTDASGAGFAGCVLEGRVQKVQRYSFQRPFTEAYQLEPTWDKWRTTTASGFQPAKLGELPSRRLLPRRVAYPEFRVRQPSQVVSNGRLKTGLTVANPWKDRSLTAIGPKLAGYPERELVTIPSLELQTVSNATSQAVRQPYSPAHRIELKGDAYETLDFGCNLTGFIGAEVVCRAKTRLLFTFDEILSDGEVDFKRLGCVNAVVYELEPGAYALESFEPYTLRFLKVLTLGGDCEVGKVWLREYAGAGVDQAQFAASDERLNRLFNAGRETFRQNALDIFMDCPSRERAGWLCDSYFTARVALDLCGDTRIERNFIENFLLPERFEFLPDGMLPMCYPADHNDGVFIPNWSLWFVLELEEYLARSGDRATVDALRPRVLRLLDYFKKFRNSDGLLEKLEGWVFVEWSAANSFVQDVNYPSNMLYAKALSAAGRMYQIPELDKTAEQLRDTIRRQAFDGEFFVDNAIRTDGKLQVTTNRTEVCQYFAFYFGVASPARYPGLWETLRRDFGPNRKQTKAHAQVLPANAFVGNVLRLELLSREGLCQQLLDESLAYQLYMVERTGTLWENDGAYASCDHGFASHGGVHVLFRDVLGIEHVDPVRKVVRLRFTGSKLDWCEGRIPTPGGNVELAWRREGGKLLYRSSVPAGYTVEVKQADGVEAVRIP